jgi:hypothetical protein
MLVLNPELLQCLQNWQSGALTLWLRATAVIKISYLCSGEEDDDYDAILYVQYLCAREEDDGYSDDLTFVCLGEEDDGYNDYLSFVCSGEEDDGYNDDLMFVFDRR